MKIKFKLAFITTSLLLSLTDTSAADYQTANLQLLHGSTFEVGKKERTVMTFEQANSWNYGSNYFFFDVTNPSEADTSIYGEFSPSLSGKEILNLNLSDGLIKDIKMTATAEFGNNFRANLYGAGIDLNVPYFQFLLLNLYARDTARTTGTTAQLTVAWKLPFKIASANFLSTGFADFAGKEGPREANQLVAPQILYDIGKEIYQEDKVYVGIEYQYWRNKFGLKDVNESVIQFMLKSYLY